MLKVERQKTIRLLEKSNGDLTVAPDEMHAVIMEAWVPHIMRKYEAAEPPPIETLKVALPEYDSLSWKPTQEGQQHRGLVRRRKPTTYRNWMGSPSTTGLSV